MTKFLLNYLNISKTKHEYHDTFTWILYKYSWCFNPNQNILTLYLVISWFDAFLSLLGAGMALNARRWTRPATSTSPRSASRSNTACSSPTCCCSAARALTRRSPASAPAETTWKDRWRCARTAYNALHGSRRKPGANTRRYRLETNRRGGSSRLRSSISPNKMKRRFIFGANLNPNEFQPDILEAACGNTAPCWRGGNTVILSLWKSFADWRKRQDWRLVWLYENVPWFYTVTAHRLCEATRLHVNNKNTQFIFILHGAKWIHTHLIVCVCIKDSTCYPHRQ